MLLILLPIVVHEHTKQIIDNNKGMQLVKSDLIMKNTTFKAMNNAANAVFSQNLNNSSWVSYGYSGSFEIVNVNQQKQCKNFIQKTNKKGFMEKYNIHSIEFQSWIPGVTYTSNGIACLTNNNIWNIKYFGQIKKSEVAPNFNRDAKAVGLFQ